MKFSLILLIFLSTGWQVTGQNKVINNFIFGHSLIDHRPPSIPTPSDETTVPHWMYLLAQSAGHSYSAGGKYGFLPQHAMVPPFSQWGYDLVPGVWESDTESFANTQINTILITAGNFMQWQQPSQPYPNDPDFTVISATETVLDWVHQQRPSTRYYIYENWPDLAGYLKNGFPPSNTEWIEYNNYTTGDFHDWWIQYHDALLTSRPNHSVYMIPVGPILHKIIQQLLFNKVAWTDLYEDDAPHGRANLYFLAGLITYAAIFEEKPPGDFNIPALIHSEIQNQYPQIIEIIWEELKNFNTYTGKSRVFSEELSSNQSLDVKQSEIKLFPNPSSHGINIHSDKKGWDLTIRNTNGQLLKHLKSIDREYTLDIAEWPTGIYHFQFIHPTAHIVLHKKAVVVK